MIFVCLGSREYQFNRLLKKIDELIIEGIIKEEVFAQVGQSDYVPVKYQYIQFLNPNEFQANINKARIVISHGGTGALINALKKRKKVIGVPRLSKFKEHTDDHQLQIIEVLVQSDYIVSDVTDNLDKLKYYLLNDTLIPVKLYISTGNILNTIERYINELK